MDDTATIVIVGAGPAGLAAARAGAEVGAMVGNGRHYFPQIARKALDMGMGGLPDNMRSLSAAVVRPA